MSTPVIMNISLDFFIAFLTLEFQVRHSANLDGNFDENYPSAIHILLRFFTYFPQYLFLAMTPSIHDSLLHYDSLPLV